MTEQDVTGRVKRAAARAAEAAPGVAFLGPGPAELVRGTALPYPERAGSSGAPSGGVRARRWSADRGGRPGWHVELHLAVLRGHRALDVARAVRAAVADAVRAELGPGPAPVSVAVTVTDIA